MTALQLRPYQVQAVDHVLEHERSALWLSMGAGKTAAMLTSTDRRMLCGDVDRTLVIAPLRVARSVWPKECKIWTPHLNVDFIGGEGSRSRDLTASKAPIVSINFENVPQLVQQHIDGKKRWPYQQIIVDEASKLRGYRHNKGTARAGALMKAAWSSKYFSELTGTPSPNGLMGIWGQLYFLDRGVRLGRTMEAFTHRWFRPPWKNEYGPQILDHSQAEIQERVKDICLSIDLSKYLDMQKPVVNDVEIELPPKAKAMYREMERKYYAELADGKSVEAFNAAVKSNKLLQMANGAVYHDREGNWTDIHDVKLDALESIVNELGGAPLMVIYQYKPDLAKILKRFPQARQLKTQKDEDDFSAGKLPMLVLHPGSGGHGLSLHQHCNNAALYGLTFDLELYQQVLERIGPARQAQAGKTCPVFIHRIMAIGTQDYEAAERLDTKESVQAILMRAAQRVLKEAA